MAAPLSTAESRASVASANMGSYRSSRWSRPKTQKYTWRAIKAIPRRLLHPPSAGVPMLPMRRTLQLTPAYDIKLEDMLDGKHLPPLALSDFEEWLMFTEHSAENLYFLQWLRDYTPRYRSGRASPAELSLSFVRAKATFFMADGSLQLNLPSHIVRDIMTNTLTYTRVSDPAGSSAPDPEIFHQAKVLVEEMLGISLAKFVNESFSNADVGRRCYTMIGGLIGIFVGLVPVLVSIIGGYSRWIRFLGIPCFWTGALAVLGGYGRVCIIIYFWGDLRQLRGYELDMPSFTPLPSKVSSSAVYPPGSESTQRNPPMHDLKRVDTEDDDLYLTKSGDLEQAQPHPYTSPPSYQIRMPSLAITRDEPGQKHVPAANPPLLIHGGKTSKPAFDFDSLPSPPSSERPRSIFSTAGGRMTPVFGPVTRVVSPIVVRAQWEIVKRSTQFGFLLAIIIMAICIVLPFRDHRPNNW